MLDVVGQPVSLSLAFIAGLLGSAHCIGMCGALVSGFFMKFGGDASRGPLPYLAYHLARIGIYTLVGIAAASLGMAVVSTGVMGAAQGVLQIIIGLLVVLIGLDILGMAPWRISVSFLPVQYLRQAFAAATRRGPIQGAALGGVINGFMPCPLTFALAVKATAAPSPLEGGLLMLAFGAGTLPSMLFVSLAFGLLGQRVRGVLVKGAAVVVIVMGAGTVLQGATYFNIMRGLVF
ncbi:MAG: sulfite exporter TauE/SafE family protein [Gammaproteobacteria bacterium]|nr:sulfite exporter TauE/SafE family protein [Gammaproteobacteria bacterium]